MHRICLRAAALLIIAGVPACPSPKPPGPIATFDGPAGGSIGHNGLVPEAYHANKDALQLRMKAALTSAAGTLDLGFGPLIDASKLLVDDSVSCAVARGTVGMFKGAAYSADAAYVGTGGLLATAGGWPAAMLPAATREDLHTCLATRLNPSGATVSIWLGGSHVANDGLNHSEYVVDEALWSAIELPGETAGAPDRITLQVWPADTIQDACANSAAAAVSKRVCGSYAGTAKCSVAIRADRADCVQTGEVWSCPRAPGDGTHQPVIQTRMRCDDWCTFYPGCAPPKGVCPKLAACPAVTP